MGNTQKIKLFNYIKIRNKILLTKNNCQNFQQKSIVFQKFSFHKNIL